jgi:hypothetical protein
VQRDRRSGTAAPAAPASQGFWVARSQGRSPAVDWKIRDGSYRGVLMNADGRPGVSTRSSFGVKVPYLSGISVGLLLGGLVLAGAGVATALIARAADAG